MNKNQIIIMNVLLKNNIFTSIKAAFLSDAFKDAERLIIYYADLKKHITVYREEFNTICEAIDSKQFEELINFI